MIEWTDWVSSLPCSHKKDRSLRIFLDIRHLNTALKRPHYKIPTIEELSHYFAGAKFFYKSDAKTSYWSIHLGTALMLNDKPIAYASKSL